MKIYGKLIPEFIYHPCAGHDLQQAMQSDSEVKQIVVQQQVPFGFV